MLYPDPAQRIVLGWSIRWVASLFALLMVMAGTLPALTRFETEPSRGDAPSAHFATADDERFCSVEIPPATTDLLGAKTFSEGGSESEKAEEKANTAPGLPSADRLARDLAASRAAGFDDRPLSRIDASAPLAPRAPPIA